MRALLHVSDLHFGPKHLPELAGAVAALAERERPDVVVVSGDLTQRAKPEQFRQARAFLERLPAPVVFAPGNHDVPLWRIWERVFAPYGVWRRHFAPELERDYVDDEVAVVAVNTAHGWTTKHGRVDRARRERLARRLAAAPAGAARVVVAHHPVARLPETGAEPALRGSAPLLRLLAELEVDLVLSGHLHHSFVSLPAEDRDGPAIVHCGTTSSSRGRAPEAGGNSLVWIEIGAREAALSRRLWEPAAGAFREAERRVVQRRG